MKQYNRQKIADMNSDGETWKEELVCLEQQQPGNAACTCQIELVHSTHLLILVELRIERSVSAQWLIVITVGLTTTNMM